MLLYVRSALLDLAISGMKCILEMGGSVVVLNDHVLTIWLLTNVDAITFSVIIITGLLNSRS